MKRLFYSTIAVLAFSVSSMANTIEVEELKSIGNQEINTYEVIARDCQEEADFIMSAIIDGSKGLDDRTVWKEAVWWGNVALALCEGYSWEQIVN
jgi:hypothetical protein